MSPAVPSPSDVVDAAERNRFELEVDGRLSILEYRRRDDRVIIVHTEVPPELEGRGLGGVLVRAAIDDAAARGSIVEPRCPFAFEWLRRHPEVAALVEIDWPPQPA